jgi:hypothetical protein
MSAAENVIKWVCEITLSDGNNNKTDHVQADNA